MKLESLQPGDLLYAAMEIVRDGTVPGFDEGQTIAAQGTRGVLINTGYLEEQPSQTLYLVRFETAEGLGPATACAADELRVADEGDEPSRARL